MTESPRSPSAFTVAAFVSAVILGGGNFLAVRFSNEELDPFWGAGLRFVLAAALFVIAALVLRLKWPRGRQLLMIALYGLFTFTLSYALMYWAIVRVSAGMAAVVLAMVPLITLLLAVAQRLERLSWRVVLGALIALSGIVGMTVGADGLALPVDGLVAILLATVTVSESVILSKRVSSNHPVTVNAVGMSVGSPLLLVVSLLAGETWALPIQPETVGAVVYLVTVGSVALFLLILFVVRRWTASVTAYTFVLFPIVTLVGEAWLFDEPLTLRSMLAALVVMAGVWLGAFSRRGKAVDQDASKVPANEYSAGPTIQATPSRKSMDA